MFYLEMKEVNGIEIQNLKNITISDSFNPLS